jgi:hypothetical protein
MLWTYTVLLTIEKNCYIMQNNNLLLEKNGVWAFLEGGG